MITLRLDAEIAEDGHLKVELPNGLPVGKVQIVLEIPETPWTDEELAALMKPEPITGAEIVAAGLTGGWRDLNISDGATWVEEQRRKNTSITDSEAGNQLESIRCVGRIFGD